METIESLKSAIEALKEELALEKSRNIVNTSILEGSNLIVWAVNLDFELISFNQNYFRELFSDDKNKKITFYENGLLKTQKANIFWPNRYKEAAQGISLHFEIRLNSKPKPIWKGVFLNATYSNTGEIIAVSGVAYDITEKMQSRIDLQKSEQKFRTIFESFQDLYFRCDLDGKITMLSPSVETISGFTADELIGSDITNFYIYNKRTKSLIKRLVLNEKIQNLEFDLIHKNGFKIPCNCNLNLVLDGNNPSYIEGVARDITELKRTNEQLKESKTALQKSLKIKERFLANMSHEIRTPLNGIMGMIHLLHGSELSKKQEEQIRSLQSSADILLDLLNDLLDFSKMEAGKMALRPSHVLLESVIQKLKHLYITQANEKQIEILFVVKNDVPEVIITDEVKLFQIFSNLLSNAIKFTNRGGQIVLTLEVKSIDGDIIWLKGGVQDDGMGISKKDQKSLFKSFTQVDNSNNKSYQGTGLGLHLTKGLVKLFGGKVKVRSKKGKGSYFSFTFKTSKGDINLVPKEELTPPPGLVKDTNVLVVDDNNINLQLANEILTKVGAHVSVAKSGFEALRLCGKKQFDVIIMDIQMPGMDGITTMNKIRNQLKLTIPILSMTAYGKQEDFKEKGFDDNIDKPIKPALLIDKVMLWSHSKKPRLVTEADRLIINEATLKKLAHYGGNDMISEVLQEFKSEMDVQLPDLKKLAAEMNFEEVCNTLHTIKGNAGTLGLEQIYDWVAYMESITKTKKYHTFGNDLQKLENLYEQFKKDKEHLTFI